MSNDTKLILALAAAAGAGFLIYTATSGSNNPYHYQNGTYVPPGTQVGPYYNQGSTGMWVNFAGQIFNTLGTLIGTLANNGVFTPADDSEDEDDGTWVILGSKIGCACEHADNSLGIDEIDTVSNRMIQEILMPGLPRCATNLTGDPCPDDDLIMAQLTKSGYAAMPRPIGGL